MKECPYCAEEIQAEAIVCRYCGRDINPELVEQGSAPQGLKSAASGNALRLEDQAAKAQPALRKPKWKQIGVAVLLAGAIPITLSVLMQALLSAAGTEYLPAGLGPLVSAIYLSLNFLFHLVPLPLGLWAGFAWPGTHLRGHTLLGLSAGSVEVVTGWLVSSSLAFSSGPLGTIDYLFALGTGSLFIAGGLFGDLCEKIIGWRRVRDLRHISYLWGQRALDYDYRVVRHETDGPERAEQAADRATRSRTDKASQQRVVHHQTDRSEPAEQLADTAATSQPNKLGAMQVLLIQTMVPGTFTLVGTIITACATVVAAGSTSQ